MMVALARDEDGESSNRNSLHSNAIHNEDYIDRGADNNVGDVGTGTNGINVTYGDPFKTLLLLLFDDEVEVDFLL